MSKKPIKTRVYNFPRHKEHYHGVSLTLQKDTGVIKIELKEFNSLGLPINLYGFSYDDLSGPEWRRRVLPAIRSRLYRWRLFVDNHALREIAESIIRLN